MRVKVTIERTVFEDRIIEMDEKFRQCACPINEVPKVPGDLFEEAAREASKILRIPLADEDDGSLEVICCGECMDNGEMIFEV